MRAIDLFCGAGGFSLGAHWAGIDVVRAFDVDPVLTSSFSYNFPETKLTLTDLSEVSGVDILKSFDGKPDMVFGGPPCQGFSLIGRRDASDPRRSLLRHFFRLVAEIRPSVFVMENVLGLVHGNSRCELDDALELVAGRYEVIGPIVLDAADYGAPTTRKRLFVVGVDSRSCGVPDLGAMPKERSVSVRDAIWDLMSASQIGDDAEGFDWWQLPNGEDVSEYAVSLRSRNLRFTGNRPTAHSDAVVKRFSEVGQGKVDSIGRHPRLDWNGQCPTLRAGTGADKGSYQSVRPIHPSENRVITVREAARLQGFPDYHRFHPTVWHSFRMIGNSVSPLMAKALFSMVVTHCEPLHVASKDPLQRVG